MERTKCELLVLIHPYKEEKEIFKKVRRTIGGGERTENCYLLVLSFYTVVLQKILHWYEVMKCVLIFGSILEALTDTWL